MDGAYFQWHGFCVSTELRRQEILSASLMPV
jgi:hypothetical protein